MPESRGEKLQSVAAVRVLAMLMIIAFHSMLFYTGKWWQFDGPVVPLWVCSSNFLNAIDLPMFVFISGFLFAHLYVSKNKYRDKMQFVLGKARRLLLPYLLWGVFMVVAMPSLNNWGELLTGISHLWFLLMLSGVFFIAIWTARFLCLKASPAQWGLTVVGTCLLFGLFHTYSTHHFFLCIHAVLFYLPTFLIGMCCARFRLQSRMPVWLAGVLFPTATALLAVYMFCAEPLPFFADYAVQLLTGQTIIFGLFALLCQKSHFSGNTAVVIAHLDKLSLGIYIFNQIVINAFLLLPGTAPFLREHYHVGVPLLFFVGLAVPWILSMLFNRFKCLKWMIG